MTPEKALDMLAAAGADGFTAPELCVTPELIDHAPIMAAQIACMHYEYAVLEDVGYWRRRGEWVDTVEEARDYRDMKREEAPMCIVRRLVGETEVVE